MEGRRLKRWWTSAPADCGEDKNYESHVGTEKEEEEEEEEEKKEKEEEEKDEEEKRRFRVSESWDSQRKWISFMEYNTRQA